MFVSDSKLPCSENGLVLLDGLYMYRDRQISFDLYCHHCLNSTELYSMHECPHDFSSRDGLSTQNCKCLEIWV